MAHVSAYGIIVTRAQPPLRALLWSRPATKSYDAPPSCEMKLSILFASLLFVCPGALGGPLTSFRLHGPKDNGQNYPGESRIQCNIKNEQKYRG